jgi:hypothetical protein
LNHLSGVMAGYSPSKAGVNALAFRPSTPCLLGRGKKDMDARDKRGHDAGSCDPISKDYAFLRKS